MIYAVLTWCDKIQKLLVFSWVSTMLPVCLNYRPVRSPEAVVQGSCWKHSFLREGEDACSQSQASIFAFKRRFCTALHRASIGLCALLPLPSALLGKAGVLSALLFLGLLRVTVCCSAWKDTSVAKYLLWNLFWETFYSLLYKGSLILRLLHSRRNPGRSVLFDHRNLTEELPRVISISHKHLMTQRAFFKVRDVFHKLHCVKVLSITGATSC